MYDPLVRSTIFAPARSATKVTFSSVYPPLEHTPYHRRCRQAAQLSPHPSSTVCRYVGSIDHYPYDGNVGIPLQRPDFILAGTAPPNTTADNPELTDGIDPSSMLWRQATSFIEVKPDNAEGPYRGHRTRGKKVVIRLLAQAADHARVILRARVRSSSTLSA